MFQKGVWITYSLQQSMEISVQYCYNYLYYLIALFILLDSPFTGLCLKCSLFHQFHIRLRHPSESK